MNGDAYVAYAQEAHYMIRILWGGIICLGIWLGLTYASLIRTRHKAEESEDELHVLRRELDGVEEFKADFRDLDAECERLKAEIVVLEHMVRHSQDCERAAKTKYQAMKPVLEAAQRERDREKAMRRAAQAQMVERRAQYEGKELPKLTRAVENLRKVVG